MFVGFGEGLVNIASRKVVDVRRPQEGPCPLFRAHLGFKEVKFTGAGARHNFRGLAPKTMSEVPDEAP